MPARLEFRSARPRVRSGTARRSIALVAGCALVLSACAGDSSDLESLATSGPPSELAFVEYGPLAVVDATTGQCFNEAADLGSVSQLSVVAEVACSTPHDYEVFDDFVVDIDTDAPFPGSGPIQEEAAARCPTSFEVFSGRAYSAAGPELYAALWPTEESWNGAEDRTVLCVAFAADNAKLQGSIAAG